MATEDDIKADEAGDAPPHPTEDETERANELISPKDRVVAVVEDGGTTHDADLEGGGALANLEAGEDGGNAPAQLGYTRYVYAAYMAGAIAVAFLLSKIGEYGWHALSQKWVPTLGEPKGEIIIPVSGLLGALVAIYYFRQQKTRELAEDVASELSKVTWPNKQEVMNSTAVVIFTTAFSTIFFALMDRFWGFLTNLVYGT